LKPTQINDAVKFMQGLYKAFVETDSSLLEINPFITTKDDKLFALDCKINFDDNAIFRHKELKELRDIAEEDPLEVEASKFALNYIKLDGNIACMVNGAGLAMATMDIIQYAGDRRRTSSMWAAARTSSRSSRRSRFCFRTRT
jgi:succinyl-CoA synthetase beta subunit